MEKAVYSDACIEMTRKDPQAFIDRQNLMAQIVERLKDMGYRLSGDEWIVNRTLSFTSLVDTPSNALATFVEETMTGRLLGVAHIIEADGTGLPTEQSIVRIQNWDFVPVRHEDRYENLPTGIDEKNVSEFLQGLGTRPVVGFVRKHMGIGAADFFRHMIS